MIVDGNGQLCQLCASFGVASYWHVTYTIHWWCASALAAADGDPDDASDAADAAADGVVVDADDDAT